MNSAQLPNGGKGVGRSWERPRGAVGHQRVLVGHVHGQGWRRNSGAQVRAHSPRRIGIDELGGGRDTIGAVHIGHQVVTAGLGDSPFRDARIQLQTLEHFRPTIVVDVGVELPVTLGVSINQSTGLEIFLGVMNHRIVGHAPIGEVNLAHRVETHLNPIAIDVATRGQQSIHFTTGDHLRAARHRVDPIKESPQTKAGIQTRIPGGYNS